MFTAEIMNQIENEISCTVCRSAWGKGVKQYAVELLDNLTGTEPLERAVIKKALLNGARDWHQYSEGGSALIYDADIAFRLCSPSELKKTDNGNRNPNARESWLDVQARALYQAGELIIRTINRIADRNV